MNDQTYHYQEDQTAVAQAMMRAQEAQDVANRAKQEALAVEAKRQAQQAEIDAAVEIAMRNYERQRQAFPNSHPGAIRSQDVGVIAPKDIVESTNVRIPSLGNYEVSHAQAADMAELGQISRAEFKAAVADGLAKRGFAAPPSFR
ncbi:EF-hand domain-containing protein [Mesorhizobium sp. M1E.F.Ca.ET.041.01.1.1]|uniref:EF-hand domain-containing protein n=1 Tax=Mesorhizobium sp. M1E.F.Ca.ET.041.01.1.1 TaxID=2496759 RepID=UPI000FCACEDB|nr:EF-hand domain-containing protein [Mesorhizobium sp. M1E.F.Ca.ET.041.01.1.1]RUW33787.1 hypothetical protein EOA38_12100 [Mesorhizobium sp. M1E.F.Ca.ET.041.01.1.1]RWD92373.1 MAG: hypothetical protein EOS38_00640 [Mesorhizobium sp.]